MKFAARTESDLAGTTAPDRTQGAEARVAPGEGQDARPGDPPKVGEVRSAATVYRVIWGLGRHEDFLTAAEADARADEIHKGMVEDWPLLAGTNDGSLPRVVEVSRVY